MEAPLSANPESRQILAGLGAESASASLWLGGYLFYPWPGSCTAPHGANPGRNRVRVALVAPLAECVEAAQRIARFARSL